MDNEISAPMSLAQESPANKNCAETRPRTPFKSSSTAPHKFSDSFPTTSILDDLAASFDEEALNEGYTVPVEKVQDIDQASKDRDNPRSQKNTSFQSPSQCDDCRGRVLFEDERTSDTVQFDDREIRTEVVKNVWQDCEPDSYSIGLLNYTTERSSDHADMHHHEAFHTPADVGDSEGLPVLPREISPETALRSRQCWKYVIVMGVAVLILLVALLLSIGLPMLKPDSDDLETSGNAKSLDNTLEPLAKEAGGESSLPSISPHSSPTQVPSIFPRTSYPTALLATPAPTPTKSPTVAPSLIPSSRDQTLPPSRVTSLIFELVRLPGVPEIRFTPFDNLTTSILDVATRGILGYNTQTWNLPGSANNDGNSDDDTVFWEGLSFGTIQNSNPRVISAIAELNFTAQTWDCWVNHYQDCTWEGLYRQSDIKVTIVEDENRQDTAVISGRDLQFAVETLGWSESNWDTQERRDYFFPHGTSRGPRPPWDQLDVLQQRAALALCWTQELWDRTPLPEWGAW